MQDIFSTIVSEFSDLSDLSAVVRVVLRLFVAAALGALLGLERELKGKNAGLKTHMLVSLGTALFILVTAQSGINRDDLSRVIQGIAQGVGFLGMGNIVVGTAKSKAQGLTTAASVWATAGVGIAAGLGMEATAILSTLCIFCILSFAPRIGHKPE